MTMLNFWDFALGTIIVAGLEQIAKYFITKQLLWDTIRLKISQSAVDSAKSEIAGCFRIIAVENKSESNNVDQHQVLQSERSNSNIHSERESSGDRVGRDEVD